MVYREVNTHTLEVLGAEKYEKLTLWQDEKASLNRVEETLEATVDENVEALSQFQGQVKENEELTSLQGLFADIEKNQEDLLKLNERETE